MDAAFYDPTLSYEENFTIGPLVFRNHISPPPRAITQRQKFLGFEVNIPFGIPAGPLLNAEYCKAAFAFGFDVNHYKTQRSVPFPVNRFPNVIAVQIDGDLTLEKAKRPLTGEPIVSQPHEPINITNSFGNPSQGPDFWQQDMKKAVSYAGPEQLLIASVVGTIQEGFSDKDYYNDFAKTAYLAKETGVKVIEINLSCPNVANEGIVCYNPDADEAICRKVKEKIGDTPLLLKLGYFSEEQEQLLQNIIKRVSPFIAGIAAINTIPAPVIDKNGKQALPGPNRLMSGICGSGIRWAGLEMVKRLAAIRDSEHLDYAIIGVGGVMNHEDYADYRNAGADLVQSATGSMWNAFLADEIFHNEQKSGM